MNQKYSVSLSNEQRSYFEKIISSGETSARKITRARILLKSDRGEQGANWSYKKIVEALDVSEMLVCDVRRRFAQGGVEKALERKKPERDYHQILDGDAEAHLVALACGDEPEGAARWTLRLLQKEMIRRNYVQAISHETIRQVLKKMNLSLG